MSCSGTLFQLEPSDWVAVLRIQPRGLRGVSQASTERGQLDYCSGWSGRFAFNLNVIKELTYSLWRHLLHRFFLFREKFDRFFVARQRLRSHPDHYEMTGPPYWWASIYHPPRAFRFRRILGKARAICLFRKSTPSSSRSQYHKHSSSLLLFYQGFQWWFCLKALTWDGTLKTSSSAQESFRWAWTRLE